MKKLIFLFLLTFVVLGNFKVSAQENDRIYISVYQPDKDEITSEASKHLTNKMKNLILAHGISDEDDNNRFVWIRCKGECYECNPNLYLPFGVGCIVEGDVVFDVKTLVEMFYIKKCYTDPYNQDAKNALNHYRRNMNTINSIIRERRNKI